MVHSNNIKLKLVGWDLGHVFVQCTLSLHTKLHRSISPNLFEKAISAFFIADEVLESSTATYLFTFFEKLWFDLRTDKELFTQGLRFTVRNFEKISTKLLSRQSRQ